MMGVILKRMMLRAAEKIAVTNKIPAIVTGEAIAQVSSQTMTNLAVINAVTEGLVLRPLATTDKEDIIALSREIGTEDYARTMPEYCGVISDRPTTEAKMHKILAEEDNFNFEVLNKAIDDCQVTGIDKVLESAKNMHDIEMVATPAIEDVILDIRHPMEQEKAPLELTNNKIFRLPFFEIAKKFPTLDDSRKYLLYCDKGIMSQLQTQELMEQGYKNVAVYRPE
jgi:thiamine biosynthesis protein ThiI